MCHAQNSFSWIFLEGALTHIMVGVPTQGLTIPANPKQCLLTMAALPTNLWSAGKERDHCECLWEASLCTSRPL